MGDQHHHGHSLAEDMPLLMKQIERRNALRWFAGVGTAALVAGCGGEGSSDSVAVVSGTGTPAPTSSTPTPTTDAHAHGDGRVRRGRQRDERPLSGGRHQ